jgi:hypothetical protein
VLVVATTCVVVVVAADPVHYLDNRYSGWLACPGYNSNC